LGLSLGELGAGLLQFVLDLAPFLIGPGFSRAAWRRPLDGEGEAMSQRSRRSRRLKRPARRPPWDSGIWGSYGQSNIAFSLNAPPRFDHGLPVHGASGSVFLCYTAPGQRPGQPADRRSAQHADLSGLPPAWFAEGRLCGGFVTVYPSDWWLAFPPPICR
jgi:hypothetical protein